MFLSLSISLYHGRRVATPPPRQARLWPCGKGAAGCLSWPWSLDYQRLLLLCSKASGLSACFIHLVLPRFTGLGVGVGPGRL